MRNKADELEERVDTIIGKKRKAKELEQEDEEVKASECASRRVSADFFPLLIWEASILLPAKDERFSLVEPAEEEVLAPEEL